MDIEYDEDVDAAFVWLVGRPDNRSQVVDSELWPEELKGKVGLLFDAQKRLIGLEVLEASSRLPGAVLVSDSGSVQEGATLGSRGERLALDALGLQGMASGHQCLNLSERIGWEDFPDYAHKLLTLIQGSKVSVVDGPDLRLWQVLVEGTELRLVYDDYPQMVSLESDTDEGDRLLQLLMTRLSNAESDLQ